MTITPETAEGLKQLAVILIVGGLLLSIFFAILAAILFNDTDKPTKPTDEMSERHNLTNDQELSQNIDGDDELI